MKRRVEDETRSVRLNNEKESIRSVRKSSPKSDTWKTDPPKRDYRRTYRGSKKKSRNECLTVQLLRLRFVG